MPFNASVMQIANLQYLSTGDVDFCVIYRVGQDQRIITELSRRRDSRVEPNQNWKQCYSPSLVQDNFLLINSVTTG